MSVVPCRLVAVAGSRHSRIDYAGEQKSKRYPKSAGKKRSSDVGCLENGVRRDL
jgi:hypothetical protein